jgi:tetratricopeptide (TPR) repeat protein
MTLYGTASIPFERGFGASAWIILLFVVASDAAGQEFPPPRVESDPPVRFEDFVGAEACGGCHEARFRAWQQSAHGRAGGPPGPETLIAGFDGTPIRFRDALVTPSTTETGVYRFTVQRVGRPAVEFQVDGVIGGAHMVGGGTQGFVSRYPDGTVRFLPFDFVRHEGVWFCNTANILGWWTTEADRSDSRLDVGWVPITQEMRLADCGDWPPIRTLGTTTDFQNCQDCHGSQILLRFDDDASRYETRLASLTINCESCHGPGRSHVELMEAGTVGEDIGLPSLAVLGKDESLQICFRCHAVKQPLQSGYLPGMDLERFYSVKAPLWIDEPLRPDGRIRTFAYQMNHLYSDCYLNGPMTCVDCHAPHGLGYRDIRGRPLEGRFDDGQCLDCHPSKAEDVSAHTHHAPDSQGSSCVACHMPYRQHPTVGESIRFSRADHTIPIPRPSSEDELGTDSACALCHSDRPPEELEAQVRTWYGELKPYHPLVEGILVAADVEDEARARSLLLRPDLDHPAAQAHALGNYIRRFLRPAMQDLDPGAIRVLIELARGPDLDVRALALAGLHLAKGQDPFTRSLLTERLGELGALDGAVRRRWVLVLRTMGDAYLGQGDTEGAVAAYQRALEVIPEHAGALSDLGLAVSSAQRFEEAVAYYDRSLEADPSQTQVLVNRGVTLENLGLAEEAIASYELAVERNPGEALAHFNLGNVRFVRGEYREALEYYRTSVRHNPRLVNGHLMLAQTFILVGRPDSAAVFARNVLEFDPTNEAAQRMLIDLIR